MGKVEVRVSDGQKAEWRAVALERGVSVSEFVRAAVEQELGKGVSVAAGPPVVEAERDAWVVPSADPATWRPVSEDAKVVKPEVSYLRRLMEDSSEAVPFAPAAPPGYGHQVPSAPVDARTVFPGPTGKRSVTPDPKSG